MGNPKGPVKGGASCSVEDAGDAASLGISGSLKKVGCFHLSRIVTEIYLVVLPMNGKESVVSSVCQVIHCVVSRSWCRCVAPVKKVNPSG